MEKNYMALVGAILIIVAYYLIDFFTEFLFIFAIGDKIEYGIGNFLYLATSITFSKDYHLKMVLLFQIIQHILNNLFHLFY